MDLWGICTCIQQKLPSSEMHIEIVNITQFITIHKKLRPNVVSHLFLISLFSLLWNFTIFPHACVTFAPQILLIIDFFFTQNGWTWFYLSSMKKNLKRADFCLETISILFPKFLLSIYFLKMCWCKCLKEMCVLWLKTRDCIPWFVFKYVFTWPGLLFSNPATTWGNDKALVHHEVINMPKVDQY